MRLRFLLIQTLCGAIAFGVLLLVTFLVQAQSKDLLGKGEKRLIKSEVASIEVDAGRTQEFVRTNHPDAQWFHDAGLGLLIHWGISSVRGMNTSWSMIPGGALARVKLTAEARERVMRQGDYNLNGKPLEITPNEYWEMARHFNPKNYNPNRWLAAAKKAGFTYVVLTARHHDGFALWPTAYGDFNTKNFMRGRDLIKPFVEAARRNGLRVGLYYSPPDWHFDREYMNFLYEPAALMNPELPPLGPDLKPRTAKKSEAERVKHQAEYAALVKGQVEELLSLYGKIDLLWLDEPPNLPDPESLITIERIRELQPHIVINSRLHGSGDYISYERRLPTDRSGTSWTELRNTWTSSWPYVEDARFRANGFILGEFVTARALGINYLLGVGPTASGEFTLEIYQNLFVLQEWMKNNGNSVHGSKRLPPGETASVSATSAGPLRYLFLVPRFRSGGVHGEDMLVPEDSTLTLAGVGHPVSIRLLGVPDAEAQLEYEYAEGTIKIRVPAASRSLLVDVVEIRLQ